MRSSKSRSRSKQNRPRTLGNVINRVFDSSGPEGKVRGTPQQIIEKYQILARDAQLSNDRVAAENFMQHAEHYTRLLAEAQREMQAEQESRQQNWQQNGNNQGGNAQNGGNQNGGQSNGAQGNGGQGNGGRDRDRDRDQGRETRDNRDSREGGREARGDHRDQQPRVIARAEEPAAPLGAEVIDLSGEDDAGLVDTPETGRSSYIAPTTAAPISAAPVIDPVAVLEIVAPSVEQPRTGGEVSQSQDEAAPAQNRLRSPRARRAPVESAGEGDGATAEAKPARRPRSPRKPRAEAGGAGSEGNNPEGGPREAAE